MVNVSDWFKKHNIQIDMHINEKRPSCTPLHVWWIYLLVVAKFSRSSTTTFKCIQGHHITFSMQRTHLLTMHTSLLHAVGGNGPLSESDSTAFHDLEWVILECHRLLASISGAKQLVRNLGSFVMDEFALVDAPDVELPIKAVADLYVSSAAGVDAIVSERNVANNSEEALLPVVPHHITALDKCLKCYR